MTRECEECHTLVPIDALHTQHDPECEVTINGPYHPKCTCCNWADVCEACCNVCSPKPPEGG